MRILLAGGGTAGHTSPLLATAEVLRAAGDDLLCLGTPRGLEKDLIPAAGLELEMVPPVPLPRTLNTDLILVPWRLRATIRAARGIIDRFRPDVVVGFGGYVSVPAYVAAARAKVPLVVHEGNALPGIANKIGARLTRHVATSFPDTPLRHGQYVGLPIRAQIATLDRGALRDQARAHFGLQPDLPTVLVTGGSQGARQINQAMSAAAPALRAAGVQVLHAAGRIDEATVDPAPGQPPYVVVPFIERMDLALAAADLTVCRSGANTVTEVASAGLPAVFVPLPIGNGEQALNARPVVDAGGGVLVDNVDFTADWVRDTIVDLANDQVRLATMSRAASDLVRPDAAQRLAELIHAAGRSPKELRR